MTDPGTTMLTYAGDRRLPRQDLRQRAAEMTAKETLVATSAMRKRKGPRVALLRLPGILLCATLIVAGLSAQAQEGARHQHGSAAGAPPAAFVASTAKPFAALMEDAMAVMDHGMRTAPMNSVPEHDFVTMMIPHHQGAVDMARALLLTTKDAALRNLAQGIITEQQNEIRLMQVWLQQHAGAR